MKKLMILVGMSFAVFGATSLVMANRSEAPKFDVWTSGQLDEMQANLSADRGQAAAIKLGKHEGYNFMVARNANAGVSLHETQNDILVILSGEGTFIVGGEMIGSRRHGPNELRGASIKGGKTQRIKRGDIIHVAAGVPHEIKPDGDSEITLFSAKIDVR